MTAPPPPANLHPVPPAVCQRGHPLVWLLGTDSPLADGEALAACDCTLRNVGGRQFATSQPMLWRWVPLRPDRLHPVFPSQYRLAFALALRLRALIVGAGPLNQDVQDALHQAKHVFALAQRAQGVIRELEERLDHAQPYKRRAKAPAGASTIAPEP